MDDICPDATPLVVDVWREKIHRPSRRPSRGGFEALLENEVASLAGLREKLATAAWPINFVQACEFGAHFSDHGPDRLVYDSLIRDSINHVQI